MRGIHVSDTSKARMLALMPLCLQHLSMRYSEPKRAQLAVHVATSFGSHPPKTTFSAAHAPWLSVWAVAIGGDTEEVAARRVRAERLEVMVDDRRAKVGARDVSDMML
eukprot:CAMPEP_0196145674 /NCGR_PEP_ID=MMETSP0910-20130528/21023_1 /TAXON_ID=49265 /ORGANISM="Thalassiosira rotula, Strain GSO102" /LENGTH=107 /DNA_ID=CAMNT_0041407681 /DNA_START=123 /DNA_END=442 /DNA_ORIENTATION=-